MTEYAPHTEACYDLMDRLDAALAQVEAAKALLPKLAAAEARAEQYRIELEGGTHEGDKGLRREHAFMVEVAGTWKLDAQEQRARAEKAEANLTTQMQITQGVREERDAAEARVRELEAIDDGGRDIAYALKQAHDRVRELEQQLLPWQTDHQSHVDRIATLEKEIARYHDQLANAVPLSEYDHLRAALRGLLAWAEDAAAGFKLREREPAHPIVIARRALGEEK